MLAMPCFVSSVSKPVSLSLSFSDSESERPNSSPSVGAEGFAAVPVAAARIVSEVLVGGLRRFDSKSWA